MAIKTIQYKGIILDVIYEVWHDESNAGEAIVDADIDAIVINGCDILNLLLESTLDDIKTIILTKVDEWADYYDI